MSDPNAPPPLSTSNPPSSTEAPLKVPGVKPWELSQTISALDPPLPVTFSPPPPPPPSQLPSASSSAPKNVPSTSSEQQSSPAPTTPLPFLHLLSRLKTTPREGWCRSDVPNPESISDHMYRMSLITMFAPPSLLARGLNVAHCTKMALVHDMAEALVGDITPMDKIPKLEKRRRERESMEYMTSPARGVPEAVGRDLRAVWEEYEMGDTLEAMFVHDVDKLELLLQTVEYERRYMESRGVNLVEFGRAALGVQLDEMKAWCAEILKEREEWVAKVESRKKERNVNGGGQTANGTAHSAADGGLMEAQTNGAILH